MDKDKIVSTAHERAVAQGLPYAGSLSPAEAHELSKADEDAVIVDVRTKAELSFVGRIPDAVEVEWLDYPGRLINESFIQDLKDAGLKEENPVMFICRSGVRSHNAALLAKNSGFQQAFNVLEGFEGDPNEEGQRSSHNGWRFSGLPWSQS